MKKLLLFIAVMYSAAGMAQTPQKITFSGFTLKPVPTGTEYIVGYAGAQNIRIPVGKIAANKIDSTSVSPGPALDTTWHYKEGIKRYYTLHRAGTTGGTVTAPTVPTPTVGDNSTRIANTAAIIAERSAAAALAGKTINGATNTLLNIPQAAVTNLAADIANRITLQQLADSLNKIDTTRTVNFVNLGLGSGAYGIFENVSGNTVNALSLIGAGGTTVTRVGNNLVITGGSGTINYNANNTWGGTQTYNNNVTVNADFTVGGSTGLRNFGVPVTPSGGVTRFFFGDGGSRTEYVAGAMLDWLAYHGISARSDEFAVGPAFRATTGNPNQPALEARAHATQTANLVQWRNGAGTVIGGIKANGQPFQGGFPVFADNAAALAGGLGIASQYRTADGTMKVVY